MITNELFLVCITTGTTNKWESLPQRTHSLRIS